jgi:predicted dehydrogenase
MRKIRLGFIGAGFMGQLAHLSNYAELDECVIEALAEPRKELGREVAGRYGIKKVYNDHIDLLKHCELDAVVASQYYGNHINIVPDILNIGVPLFTEKPLCLTVENGEKLVSLARKNNVLHMVGYHKRSDPAVEYAKKLSDEWKAGNEYGKMRIVRITMPPGDWTAATPAPIKTNEPYPESKTESLPEYFSKDIGQKLDVFVNYYIHQVNALRFFFGGPYKVTYADRSGVLLAAESENGVCGTIEMAPYSTTLDWQESIFIGFEKGYIKIDLPAPLARQRAGQVTVMCDNGRNAPVIIQPVIAPVSAMQNQAMNFLAAVQGKRKAPCESWEALEDLKTARDYIDLMYT